MWPAPGTRAIAAPARSWPCSIPASSASTSDIAANLLPPIRPRSCPARASATPPIGSFNHGTHVAGIIAAPDNAFGTIGVAPQAKILAVKVLSGVTGSGSFGGIIQGIVYAADHGADVINMSLGVRGGLPVNGPGANEVAELINATKRAVQYARTQNAITIVSAGNDGRDLDHDSGVELCDATAATVPTCVRSRRSCPARWPSAATAPIGWAVDPSGNLDYLASYSNYGQSAISFAARAVTPPIPGNENCIVSGPHAPVLGLRPGVRAQRLCAAGRDANIYSWTAGTSMAAPHVSGVAALIIGKHGGEMAPSEVETILRASVRRPGQAGQRQRLRRRPRQCGERRGD